MRLGWYKGGSCGPECAHKGVCYACVRVFCTLTPNQLLPQLPVQLYPKPLSCCFSNPQASGDASAQQQQQPLASAAERCLRHALGGSRVRRWAMCEFHYSSLDRPYFMRSDMDDYLAALRVRALGSFACAVWVRQCL